MIHKVSFTDFGIGRTLSRGSAEALLAHLATVARDEDVRVLLVTGDPEVFCGGGSAETVASIVHEEPHAYYPLVEALVGFPLPVVVALEGAALGAGLGLALALGDFFVASEKARYGVHFARLGITPGMGVSFLLRERVGAAFAREMLYAGRLYRGRELRELPAGHALFDRIVSPGEVLAEAGTWAAQFAQTQRAVLVEMKELLRPDRGLLREAMERETAAFERLAAQASTAGSIHAYFEQLHAHTADRP